MVYFALRFYDTLPRIAVFVQARLAFLGAEAYEKGGRERQAFCGRFALRRHLSPLPHFCILATGGGIWEKGARVGTQFKALLISLISLSDCALRSLVVPQQDDCVANHDCIALGLAGATPEQLSAFAAEIEQRPLGDDTCLCDVIIEEYLECPPLPELEEARRTIVNFTEPACYGARGLPVTHCKLCSARFGFQLQLPLT